MFGAKKRLREMVELSYGKNPLKDFSYYNAQNRLDLIKRYHNAKEEIEENKWKVDETTWKDLEMDEVFLRLNHTNSFIGEQVLYHSLHVLALGRENEKRQKLKKRLDTLEQDEKLRTDISVQLNRIGKMDAGYYLSEFLLNTNVWKVGNTIIFHILQILLLLFFVTSISTDSLYAVLGLVLVALINLSIYIFAKQKYEIYFTSLIEFKKIFDFACWMEKKDRNADFLSKEVRNAIHKLRKISRVIIGMGERRRLGMTGDAIAILADYIWGILLIDVAMFNHIMNVIADKQEAVMCVIEAVGKLDADISILSYRKSVKQWCLPEYEADGIITKGVAHPLLHNPVTNDFELHSRAIITGSNASGKSTFMKAIAINCILAQTIDTCIAKKMRLKPLIVISCMALRDDVLTGESYYYREAKCLKRMLELVALENAVLVVIDEILKGTNTLERIAASKAILEYLGTYQCLTLVATHDNELAESSLYKNYHFCSIIEENDMLFDYQIHDGMNISTNAIALLSYLGYPEIIVKRAKDNLYENRGNR